MEEKTSMTTVQPGKPERMRTITLEEHFATPAFMEGPGRFLEERPDAAKLIERLCDIGDLRIAEMDAAGVDVQALSLCSPGVEQLDANEAVELPTMSMIGLRMQYNATQGGLSDLPACQRQFRTRLPRN